ncbi:3-dehydroquinate synthase [Desulfocapsa sp. AH-315-G09]|uniref:3-dehydroquinate synthase n=1 Tax=Desulfotalea psychrophila TaxID=84980 RepID=A0ABS3AUI8_9BACT|nr:3-dehydroquinate synthase [Desulfocapsa sp.]MBN4052899.1 3-dehydroquinate synthase [bacterium AH-315-K15]MBN4060163.1 3-dehydroquinate synthase [Desulfotalea psychrophila]MBN4065535.1 3-dehydroquinate synthase [Desulfocapsa sp. AH-315-G09]MBN4068190.1 3-dehydroquinate synthase [Desulfotalea psychrophila]
MSEYTLTVGLGERSYPIFIKDGIMETIGADLAKRNIASRYVVISDEYVAKLYGTTLMATLEQAGITVEMLTFPRGEASKNLQVFAELSSKLAQMGVDRSSGLIAFGGGVTGDLVGFLAATYMRGIPFVQIPTTLLAQVDSSVGGKTGVDIPEGKNLVGAFYQPKVVYIDTAVLTTLPVEELLGGVAEVIKYGVIRDYQFYCFLEKNLDAILALNPVVIQEMIRTCCKIKAEVVAEDEREADLRRILNFGHTIGHAVEAASDFSLIHGHAVAIGMVAALRLAVSSGLCKRKEAGRVATLIHSFGLPTEIPEGMDRERIKSYIKTDKKSIAGSVFYILPTTIGEVIITNELTEEQIDAVLQKK